MKTAVLTNKIHVIFINAPKQMYWANRMKLLTMFWLIPSMIFSQINTRTAFEPVINWPSESTLGYIYNKSSFTDTSDFTLKGGIIMSVNGGAIDVSGGVGTFDHYATILTPHSFSNYTVTMDNKMINAPSSTSYGVGLGLKSINQLFPQDIFGWVNLSTGAVPGQIFLYNSSGTPLSSSSGTITWSTNDVIRQTFALADTVITYTVQNITSGGSALSLSITYFNSLYTSLTRPNASKFAIFEIGGSFQIQALSVNITDKTNTNIVVASDSKFGYYAGSWALAWPALMNASYPTVTKCSGSGDMAAHGVQQIYNLSLLNPRYLIWEYGSNDLRDNVPLTIVEAYSDSIYNYFTARGTTVNFILVPESSGSSQNLFDLWYRSHYPCNYISAVWDSLSINNIIKPVYTSGDGIHLSAAGHAKIAQALQISGKFNLQNVSNSQTAEWTGAVNNEWSNSANWKCGQIPSNSTLVIINGGKPNYPLIIADVTIKSITVNTGAVLNVSPGVSVTITGL